MVPAMPTYSCLSPLPVERGFFCDTFERSLGGMAGCVHSRIGIPTSKGDALRRECRPTRGGCVLKCCPRCSQYTQFTGKWWRRLNFRLRPFEFPEPMEMLPTGVR